MQTLLIKDENAEIINSFILGSHDLKLAVENLKDRKIIASDLNLSDIDSPFAERFLTVHYLFEN